MSLIIPDHWNRPQDVLKPTADEVHIWYVDIDNQSYDTSQFKYFYDKWHKEHPNQLITTEKREKSVKREYFLRIILSNYIARKPEEVLFYYSDFGKPYLTEKLDKGSLQFNISNSFNYLLVALTSNNQIGIDIEKIRQSINYQKLVARFFSKKEINYFSNLNENTKEKTFFDWWTIKEAVVKTIGTGMRIPINSFNVPIDRDDNVIVIDYNEYNTQLYCYSFFISDETKSSFCTEKEVQKINFFKL